MIEVLPADGKEAFRKFTDFPFGLYSGSPEWVPPLIRDVKKQFSPSNPFFRYAEVQPFIAMKGRTVAGRITAVYNRMHVDMYEEKRGFFGFFDCMDDDEAAAALFDRVRGWLRNKGMETMRGPMNFSSNDEWGVLIDGFHERPMVMMPYNYPYYRRLYENSGFRKGKDLYAYIADVPETFPEKVYRVARAAEKRGIHVRPLDTGNFQREMQVFRDVYNSAWKRNWGFMPLTKEEIDHTANVLKPFIIPELALVAEHDGAPVAFMMFLPDMNYVLKRLNGRLLPLGIFRAMWHFRRITDARLLLFGIREGYRKRGIDSLLFIEGLKGLREKGFRRMEFSWILEDNFAVRRVISTMNGRLYKKYRVYERQI